LFPLGTAWNVPSERLAWGTYCCSRERDTGSWQSRGMTFVGKIEAQVTPSEGNVVGGGVPPKLVIAVEHGVPVQLRELSTSARVWVVTEPGNGVPAEKSPRRSASVGTVTVSDEIPWMMRRPS